MKTVLITEYGSNDVVKIQEVEKPQPNPGEVLVRIRTAGVNPIDWKIRNGAGKRIGLELPINLGSEIVGEVEKLGRSVTQFKVGDSVYGTVKVGGFSEYVSVPIDSIALKPSELSDDEAAAIPLAGLTAWQALFDNAHLTKGQKIFITGASGAVGSLAVQFAKAHGAHVIALSSTLSADFLKSIGADEVIDYQKSKLEDMVQDVDVVFDAVGGEIFERSKKVLRKGGTIVSSVAFPVGDEMKSIASVLNVFTAYRIRAS